MCICVCGGGITDIVSALVNLLTSFFREVHWKSSNEIAQEYVEGSGILGGQEERKGKEETGI